MQQKKKNGVNRPKIGPVPWNQNFSQNVENRDFEKFANFREF